MEDLKQQVIFALTRQPTEKSEAITGDAYGVMPMAFFARKVPAEWLDSMLDAELYKDHAKEGEPPSKGIVMLAFHEWVASRVSAADANFDSGAHHQSRRSNAKAIKEALTVWVHAKEDAEEEVMEITI